eukprot:SAG11_NODE_16133_length_556_cov_0.789934_2_plen_58_part_01
MLVLRRFDDGRTVCAEFAFFDPHEAPRGGKNRLGPSRKSARRRGTAKGSAVPAPGFLD